MSYGDWSSDVCSSDLQGDPNRNVILEAVSQLGMRTVMARSEERRVGKGCRLGGGPGHYKEKDGMMEARVELTILAHWGAVEKCGALCLERARDVGDTW